ncbi:MAG: hypothetical protein ACRC92_25845 [Peptostreptococcaceae bacterium]
MTKIGNLRGQVQFESMRTLGENEAIEGVLNIQSLGAILTGFVHNAINQVHRPSEFYKTIDSTVFILSKAKELAKGEDLVVDFLINLPKENEEDEDKTQKVTCRIGNISTDGVELDENKTIGLLIGEEFYDYPNVLDIKGQLVSMETIIDKNALEGYIVGLEAMTYDAFNIPSEEPKEGEGNFNLILASDPSIFANSVFPFVSEFTLNTPNAIINKLSCMMEGDKPLAQVYSEMPESFRESMPIGNIIKTCIDKTMEKHKAELSPISLARLVNIYGIIEQISK